MAGVLEATVVRVLGGVPYLSWPLPNAASRGRDFCMGLAKRWRVLGMHLDGRVLSAEP